jgi:phosphoribosyl 1,2-cyclic phosphodiesterase
MNAAKDQMVVKFWGVRGSIPTPMPQNMGTGGNTCCLEVRLPDGNLLIVDGGTGIRPLGLALEQEAKGKPCNLHVFLTHFHWDHIQGLPFFQPLYAKDNAVTFYSMRPPEETCALLEDQMDVPYFPVEFRFLPAKRSFVNVTGKKFQFGEVEVSNFPLNHPQGCHGYAFIHRGRKLVFACDLEHGLPEFDRILLAAAQGADLLIFDAQFTPDEYPKRRGWGHSTWLQATDMAQQAGAKKLILFHHNPSYNDETLQQILLAAREHFPETYLAVEGESHAV